MSVYDTKAQPYDTFDSEYCTVRYIPEDNVVLLTWKKFCRIDDYRKPAMFAASLLQQKS